MIVWLEMAELVERFLDGASRNIVQLFQFRCDNCC